MYTANLQARSVLAKRRGNPERSTSSRTHATEMKTAPATGGREGHQAPPAGCERPPVRASALGGERFLCSARQLAERLRIPHRQIRERPSIDLDSRLLQSVHEPGVRKLVLPGRPH